MGKIDKVSLVNLLHKKRFQACQVDPRSICVSLKQAEAVLNSAVTMSEKDEIMKTKDGRKVRILCRNRAFSYPIVGLIRNGNDDAYWEALACWDANGHYNGEEDKNVDLVMEG